MARWFMLILLIPAAQGALTLEVEAVPALRPDLDIAEFHLTATLACVDAQRWRAGAATPLGAIPFAFAWDDPQNFTITSNDVPLFTDPCANALENAQVRWNAFIVAPRFIPAGTHDITFDATVAGNAAQPELYGEAILTAEVLGFATLWARTNESQYVGADATIAIGFINMGNAEMEVRWALDGKSSPVTLPINYYPTAAGEEPPIQWVQFPVKGFGPHQFEFTPIVDGEAGKTVRVNVVLRDENELVPLPFAIVVAALFLTARAWRRP